MFYKANISEDEFHLERDEYACLKPSQWKWTTRTYKSEWVSH